MLTAVSGFQYLVAFAFVLCHMNPPIVLSHFIKTVKLEDGPLSHSTCLQNPLI